MHYHFDAHGKAYPHNDLCKVLCIVSVFVDFYEVCKEQIHGKHAYAERNDVGKRGEIILCRDSSHAAEQERGADCDLRKEHLSEHETLFIFDFCDGVSDHENQNCDYKRNERRPEKNESAYVNDAFALDFENHKHCAESVDRKRQKVVRKHQNGARHEN